MNQEQRQAYEWAKNQDYQSVAARFAKVLAGLVDEMTPQNKALTIEQLREMDGEPVWFDTIKRWGIVKVCQDGTFILTKSGEFEVGYITRIKYYRRPPEGEEAK